MSILRTTLSLVFLATIACSEAEDTAENWYDNWEDTASDADTDAADTDTDGKDDGKGDDKGDGTDTGKGDSGYKDCADDFDPTESCQGDWTTTLCMHEGKLYWCEDGVWKNEDDKN